MANNTASRGMVNYLNTLIFCIIAKAITVFLLVSLLFDPVRKYAYLILTVEVCLVLIISISLYRIISYEKKKAQAAEVAISAKVNITTCPDYFVKSYSKDNSMCQKSYTTPDKKLTYTFTGFTGSNMINLDTEFKDKDMKQVCTIMSNPTYRDIAWTDIKGRCAWI